MRVYYFGCWDRVGHGYHEPGGKSAYHVWTEAPWGKTIDGGILDGRRNRGKENQPEGKAVLAHLDGWTALAFWDRTVDSRGASHSTFVMDAEVGYDEALAAARAAFPRVFDRLTFEVVPA